MGQKDKNNALHLPEHHHLVSRESSGGILHSTSLGQLQGLSGAQNYVKVYGADTIGLQGRVCTPSRRGQNGSEGFAAGNIGYGQISGPYYVISHGHETELLTAGRRPPI